MDNIRLSSYHLLDDTESKKMFTSYLWPEFCDSTVLYMDSVTSPWEEPEEPSYEEIYETLQKELTRWARWYKDSCERYSVLIDAYKSIEDKLLSRVATVTESSGINSEISEGENTNSSSSSGSNNATSRKSNNQTSGQNELTLRNDTPQTGGDFTTDPYVSEASKKNISSTNEQLDVESSSNSNESTDSSSSSNSNSSRATSSLESTVATDLNTPIERLNEVRQKLRNLYADWASEFSQFVIYAD